HGTRKALVVATHHPPMTSKFFDASDEGHAPSDQMSKDLDEAFRAAGVWPDALLSAHVHNYQRFTRTVDTGGHHSQAIPYVVAGGGGRVPQPVKAGHGQVREEFRFEKSHAGHGYLLVTAAAGQLKIEYHPVPGPDPASRDEVVVPLN